MMGEIRFWSRHSMPETKAAGGSIGVEAGGMKDKSRKEST
jgi:hypothetical protein